MTIGTLAVVRFRLYFHRPFRLRYFLCKKRESDIVLPSFPFQSLF